MSRRKMPLEDVESIEEPLEDYESIKEQLNANILEISDKNEHELMADSRKEKDIIEFITKDSTFKSVIEEARNKLNLDADDAFPFTFNNSAEVIDTLVYVVAFCRGIAEPYFYKDSYSEDEEWAFKVKGEDYGVMFSQLGQEGVAKLEQENDRYIDVYGKGLITENKLRALTEELRDRKLDLETKKLEYKQILNNRPTISPLKLAENMVKLLQDKLSFEDKQKIVRVVIEKVVATPLEATIYGRIPVFEGIDNSLITINENEEKVGFESKDSNL